MRVLYFHQHFTTPRGSGGIRSYEFARALVEAGHSVTMVCGSHVSDQLTLPWDASIKAHRGVIDGIDVISFPLRYSNRATLLQRSWLFLKFAWNSSILAATVQYDVLFSTSTPLTAAIPGLVSKLCARQILPFVFEVRDLWPELPRALGVTNPAVLAGMTILEWLGYRCSDLCIALAPGIAEGIRRRSPSNRRIAMIPNGCDLNLFYPGARDPLAVPGAKPGEFVAGFTGAHGTANGLDAVLDAAAVLLARNRMDIRIVLIGDGNQKDRLAARVSQQKLTNVSLFQPVPKTEIARVTASFGCGLMILADIPAFYYGTSPNKFFDYISAGLPVVCNYPGWLADLIKSRRCGIAVRPGDASALADAVCELADHSASRNEMGRRARTLAEQQFGRDFLARSFVRALESVATPPEHSII